MDLSHNLVRSRHLGERSGELIAFSRQAVGWEWMSFSVRRLAPGEKSEVRHDSEETIAVLLSGQCSVKLGGALKDIGKRTSVFDGLPYALYIAPKDRAEIVARTTCEFALCSVPAQGEFSSKVITPAEVTTSLRGGGNASRQIVDVVPPSFPAQRLIAVEVYTPGGNWSSYPPHKHDVDQLPDEADLDEIYYYRTNHANAFGHQRLYSPNGDRDLVVTVKDGDAVLVRDGFHPVVAGPGYDLYYLNFIAGNVRTLANTEDPRHKWIRSEWKEVDPRLPLVR